MKKSENYTQFKIVFKYIFNVLSWTVFLLLIIIGAILLYYVISTKIYAARGQEFEPPFALYTIISPSMEPKIKVYDVIVNIRVDDIKDIKTGDVITFISNSTLNPGMTVTHRVYEKYDNAGNIELKTKGDNNISPDGGYVTNANFKGKTVMVIPQLGRIQFFLATKGGWFFVILIPALGVIIYDILKLFKLVGVQKKIEVISEKSEKIDEEKLKKEKRRKEELKKKFKKTKIIEEELPELKHEEEPEPEEAVEGKQEINDTIDEIKMLEERLKSIKSVLSSDYEDEEMDKENKKVQKAPSSKSTNSKKPSNKSKNSKKSKRR